MNTKHTPGPWAIGNPDGSDGPHWILVGGHTCIAALPHETHGSDYVVEDYEEREHNARLIAAAPELLAALKWALDCPDMNLDDLDLDTCAAIEAARAAIAKAEGTA